MEPERHCWTAERLSEQLARLEVRWRRADGVYATTYRGPDCIDPTPLVADLGDVASFLVKFDRAEAALEQARCARAHLWRGLFAAQGRVRLFENHDYLLGLIDLYEATGEPWLQGEIESAIGTLVGCFERDGLLVDEYDGTRRWIEFASPFNGGFIEGLIDLHAMTGEERLLEIASRWAEAWIATPYFTKHGLFARFNTPMWPAVGYLSSRFSRHGPVRLFKDNTNMVWALMALYRVRPTEALRRALVQFVDGYERLLWNGGLVRQAVADDAAEFRLVPSAFSVDLLCDLTDLGLIPERTVQLARGVAEECLRRQWPGGAFPVSDHDGFDHVDVATDIGIALWKLSELTGEQRYAEAARRSWESVQATHWTEDGLVLSVDSTGHPVDDRIVVKYQALALKSAILERSSVGIYEDRDLWSVLRDR